jgi:uncharacterized protein YkwD
MKKIYSILIVAIMALMLTGCGSSSSSSNPSVPGYPDEPGNPGNPGDSSRLGWMNENLNNYMRMRPEYSSSPDTGSCEAGLLSKTYSNKMLVLLNEIRKLHNLAPLSYDYSNEPSIQEAALMMAANGKLDHHPPSDWKCYTSSGASGAGMSNLGLGYRTLGTVIVQGWLQDGGVYTLGHRRWMLSPGMTDTSLGIVQSGSAMETMGYTGGNTNPPFIAYPYLDYPLNLFRSAMSSFAVNDGSVYSSSTRIKGPVTVNGQEVEINQLGANYGCGATVSWRYRYETNKEYTIVINGIVNAPQTSYKYKVKIVD